jgi:hypothetical protein
MRLISFCDRSAGHFAADDQLTNGIPVKRLDIARG